MLIALHSPVIDHIVYETGVGGNSFQIAFLALLFFCHPVV